MQRYLINNLSEKAGFTLIEIMITVAVVGILSSTAIPTYSSFVKRARLTEVTNSMGVIMRAYNEMTQIGNPPTGDMTNASQIETSLGIALPTTYVNCA